MKIYHNPRCSTSRKTLDLLKENGVEPEVVLYLINTPTAKELSVVLDQLGMTAFELIRKKEAMYKENYQDKEYSNKEWIDIMVANPKLIERPIVVHGNQAVIGRPIERVLEIL